MSDQNQELTEIEKIFGTATTVIPKESALPTAPDLKPKEMAMAGGTLLVAAILFAVIKNFMSKMLVAKCKTSPRAADMAGWALFFLMLLSAFATALGILDSTKLFALPYLVPICIAMMGAMLMLMMALLSKQ